jgi:iron-sulfur cluster assembly accessory protein
MEEGRWQRVHSLDACECPGFSFCVDWFPLLFLKFKLPQAQRMPLFKRCRFCHRQIIGFLMPRHERRHSERLADGQRDHVTERPERRYSGSLDGVPRHYRHDKCHRVTGMPEEVIRSYLVNPFLYNNNSFCCGCHDYVPMSELRWVETGETLQDYMDGLREAAQQPPIALTEAAIDALREYAEGTRPRVRVAVRQLTEANGGGTHSYHLELDSRPAKRGDRIFQVDSVEILVDSASLPFVVGTEIDFQTGPEGTGFRFDNPNAV